YRHAFHVALHKSCTMSLAPPQRQQQRQRQQSGDALPKSQWRTLVECLRPSRGGRRTRWSRLHLKGKFHHIAEALGWIGRDRPPKRGLQPSGQIGTKLREWSRPAAPRTADRIQIAVREFAGERAKDCDAKRVNISRLVAWLAREHFRRHVGHGAGN